MSNKVQSYVPSEVSCSVLGLNLVGFDQDSFITITPQNDRVTYRSAPDGSVTAFLNRNQTYEVEIKLVRTSPSNAFLQLLMNLYLSYGSLFKMPVHITGGGIESRFFAQDAFIKVEPKSEHGSKLKVNTWLITCFNATYYELGGDKEDNFISQVAGAVGLASEVMNILGVDPSSIVSKINEISQSSGVSGQIQSIVEKFMG